MVSQQDLLWQEEKKCARMMGKTGISRWIGRHRAVYDKTATDLICATKVCPFSSFKL